MHFIAIIAKKYEFQASLTCFFREAVVCRRESYHFRYSLITAEDYRQRIYAAVCKRIFLTITRQRKIDNVVLMMYIVYLQKDTL